MFKTHIFALLFFATMAAYTYAQPTVPSNLNILQKQLVKSNADTGRVSILVQISRYYNANSANHPGILDSALLYANRANGLAIKLSYPEGVGLSYQVMAQAWCNKKDFKKSDVLIKKAIEIFLSQSLFRDAAEAYLNMEEFYLSAGGHDYKVMIGYYEQAQPLFQLARAYDREGATLNLLGDFYQQIGYLDKSLERLNQAITAYKKVKYPFLQATYDLLGFVNMKKSRYQEALKYGLLAEKTAKDLKDTSLLLCTIYVRIGCTYFVINKDEQSENYFKKGLKIAEKYKDIPSIRIAMQSLVEILQKKHQAAEALTLLKKSIQKYPSSDNEDKIMSYSIYVLLYTDLRNYTVAEHYADSLLKTNVLSLQSPTTVYALNALTEYFTQSRQYVRAREITPVFKRMAIKCSMKRKEYQAYLMSFKADSAMKDYLSAINNYRQYFFLKDSLYDLAKTGQLEELKIKYETEQKEKSIASLERNSVLQRESLKRANTIRNSTIAGSLILLTLVILLYKSYRVNKQNSQAIHKKNLALNQLVTEKEWLLKEIHHRVKNNLQIVMGLLQRQSAYINSEEALAAIQISENRMHSIALIHQKLYQSENLHLICMPEYIHEMINYLKDSSGLGSRIFFDEQVDEIYLDVAQAVPLGLILNEAITNAIKYAYPPDENGIIKIALLSQDDGYNQLIISDNGPGLPAGFNINKVDSLGINLMRGLSKQIGGSFEIMWKPGCRISVCFKTEIYKRDLNNA